MDHLSTQTWREFPFPAQPFSVIAADQDTVIVESICPQCKGESPWAFRVGRPSGLPATADVTSAALPEAPPDASSRIIGEPYVICACGFDHKPPEGSDEHGCGALWPLKREAS